MKTLPWKKIGLLAIGITALASAVYYFTFRKSIPPNQAINPAFGEYVSTYTTGVISSGSTIRITFSRDAVDSTQVGAETSVKLFEFSPKISGTTRWHDLRTVEFKPDARLRSGQIYEVAFALSKLFPVSKELSSFQYSFQIVPQNFELTINNVKPYVKTELKRQKIEGTIQTADFAADETIEKLMTAQQEGKSLSITWTHAGEGRQHVFVVEDVSRNDQASKVDLNLNGQSLGIEQTKEESVEIPALGDFKVTRAYVEQGNSQHVVLQFSDPLSEKQDLSGLISIAELTSLDFEIKDNEVRIYPPVRQRGTRTLSLMAGIRNILNYRMAAGSNFEIVFEQLLPAVRFTGNGTILPSSDGLIMPFEAVNLKAVDVQIVRIYENNVVQFLQVNNYDGGAELRRVGKLVLRKVISLENAGVTDLGRWNRFTLDLSTMINAEPGAIYQVNIGFKKSYLAYYCEGEQSAGTFESSFQEEDWDQDNEQEESYWNYYENYYYGEDYDWDQRENPCHSSYYYGDRTIRRNVIASDLGLIAKRGGDGNTVVLVNDLKSTQPMAGVQVELFDFQQQLLATGTTGSDGKLVLNSKRNPFVLVAKSGQQRGYLKMADGESLSLSNFDVGGEQIKKGLKGFLYGERGVWRPGDSIYLSFILEDKLKLLPASHPVVFELQNPQGQVTNRIVRATSENGFYQFATATSSDAPTGNWTGRVKFGGMEMTQPIKIESIKPNRLKINLDLGVDKLTAANNAVSGKLNVKWLHGAPANTLKAEFEIMLTKGETKFARYPDFVFEDPSRSFNGQSQSIFNGYTDSEGNAQINAAIPVSENAPGVLNAVFRGKVYEESGNFSIDRFSIPYYPYTSFTGLRLPLGDKARGMLLTDTTHRVDIVTVDPDGKPTSRAVEVSIYKAAWRWWWDQSEEGTSNYTAGNYSQPIASGTIQTQSGVGAWNFKIKYPDWGRYLVRAVDVESGHATAKYVYIDWPGWAGRARKEGEAATMLSFSSDKTSYQAGESATLVIPGGENGRALVSIENGSHVLQTYWVETQKGDTRFSFEITKDMAPNVFVSVTLLQPHANTANDLPIRMYGVIPIQVEDAGTHLNPIITMPDVLQPNEEVVIKVSEKSKRKMTYTLAVVDEGLLDLTRFSVPDAWNRFYAREALGVKTWDLYDQVMGSFGGKIERILALGGDAEMRKKEDDAKVNRFKPVVKYFGPFTLDGGSQEHRFIMPQYIGSVKTMLVAGYEGAYGKAEKATPVRKPLMVLATLPRVLGPEEVMKLPVTIFANEAHIKQVKVDVKVTGAATLASGSSRSVTMPGIGDITTEFDLAVKSETGVVKVEVTATSGGNKATDVIDVIIRNPNPPVTRVQETILEPGKTWNNTLQPIGIAGTNSAVLEVSTMPPINMGQRLRYLIMYPHGCIEQTTSSVFPQLYLNTIKDLTGAEQAEVQRNIRAGIERLKLFITSDGGFAYWPGESTASHWGSSFAGHFLVEAQAKGYFVQAETIKRWQRYQKEQAQGWRRSGQHNEFSHDNNSNDLIQAFRLYTLALSGNPELPAMNRMREQGEIGLTAAWMLAAAYAKAGQPEAAKTLMSKLSTKVKPYQELAYTFGSDVRDKAIILETLILLNDRVKGLELLKDIASSLGNANAYLSTQSTAWALKSVGQFAANEQRGELKFKYSFNGKDVEASTKLPIAQVNLPMPRAKAAPLTITSNNKGTLFVRVISEGVPARGQEEDENSNLTVTVSYTDTDGAAVNPAQLEQGKEFIASVTVFNPGLRGAYKNLALNQIFPSGWEISNLRLSGDEARLNSDVPTYQDIRDDRVYSYFDLGVNQSKTFKVMLNASYAGTFYLPAVSVEAMYERTIYARKKGMVVEVTKRVSQ